MLWTWNDVTSHFSSFIQYNATPRGRRVGHSLLLYGRISGRIPRKILVVVAKEEEVFVLDIVVGLEVLVRFSVDIIVVVVGGNAGNLSLNSWRLRRSRVGSWLGRGSFFSRAQRISKLRLESQEVLLKLSLTLGVDS